MINTGKRSKQTSKLVVPFHKPSFGKEEINEIADTIRNGWLTRGPKTSHFEKAFSNFIGAKYALGTNSGTAALQLALEAAGIKAGDEVITTPFTFAATAEVILRIGAIPVFVDSDLRSCTIDPHLIHRKITPKTKAIIPVHFAGQAAEMGEIIPLAKKRKLKVIEDAAHSFPTKYKGKFVGTLGDLTCFSFYVTKTLSTGEGGMLVSDNKDFISRARLLSQHGIKDDVWKRHHNQKARHYDVSELGQKFNMSDLQASLGIHQLKKTNRFLKRRRQIARAYTKAFSAYGDLIEVPWARDFDEHAWHLYVIKLNLEKLKISRDQFMEAMKSAGIGTSVHFKPLHLHSYYVKKFGFKPQDFPNARQVFERIVSLPIYPDMTQEQVAYVARKAVQMLVR